MNEHPGVWVALLLAMGIVVWFMSLWYATFNSDRRDFREFMQEMRGMFEKILDRLDGMQDRPPRAGGISGGRSPLKLTELGECVSRDVEASKWVALHIDEVREQVKDQLPYDVQQFCERYATKDRLEADGWLERAKGSAYENGVPMDGVLFALALELRDALLSERVGA